MTPTERELRRVLKLKPRCSETRQGFLRRVALKANQLSDNRWTNLSRGAATWCNSALRAMDPKPFIPEFSNSKKRSAK